MPEVDLDFGGVGALPDEGYYRLRCDKAVYKQNKTKDGHIINLQMSLIDLPDELDNFENMKVFDNPSFKLAARWKLQEVLGAFTGEDWEEDGMKLEIDDDDNTVPVLTDATAIGLCYHDEYNGRLQLRVKNYFKDDGTIEIGPSPE